MYMHTNYRSNVFAVLGVVRCKPITNIYGIRISSYLVLNEIRVMQCSLYSTYTRQTSDHRESGCSSFINIL